MQIELVPKSETGSQEFCLETEAPEATNVSLSPFSRKTLTGGGSFRRREKEARRPSTGIKTERVGKTRKGELLRPPGASCLQPLPNQLNRDFHFASVFRFSEVG